MIGRRASFCQVPRRTPLATYPSGASAGFTLRYVGAYQECAGDDCNTPQNLAAASREVDRYFKLDLVGGYDLPSWLGRTTLQLGVNNVLDAAPPRVYNAPAASSDATTYDSVGRRVYLRMSQRFQEPTCAVMHPGRTPCRGTSPCDVGAARHIQCWAVSRASGLRLGRNRRMMIRRRACG